MEEDIGCCEIYPAQALQRVRIHSVGGIYVAGEVRNPARQGQLSHYYDAHCTRNRMEES